MADGTGQPPERLGRAVTELTVVDTGGKPFSFQQPARPEPPANAVRVPNLGEIASLLAWAFPHIQRQYPKAMQGPLQQLMRHAASAQQNQAIRCLATADAIGFFDAQRDCLEPRWAVRTRFLVHRDAPDEAEAIRAAALDWAKLLEAVTFDGEPIAESDTERQALSS